MSQCAQNRSHSAGPRKKAPIVHEGSSPRGRASVSKEDGRALGALQREALNHDVRVRAQLIAAGVSEASDANHAQNTAEPPASLELSLGLRASMSVLILIYCFIWWWCPFGRR